MSGERMDRLEALRRASRRERPRPASDVVRACAEYAQACTGVTVEEMLTHHGNKGQRSPKVSRARGIMWTMLAASDRYSLTGIAMATGKPVGFDHSSVHHGIKRLRQMQERDGVTPDGEKK